MRRKYVALTLGLVMTGMLLGGCGNSKDTGSTADIASSKDAAASSSPSTDQKSSDKKDENTVYGKITKADGNTITYEVLERQDNGAMPQGSKAPDGASKPEGTPPAQKDNSNSNSDQQQSDSSNTNSDQKPEGTPPAKPEGSANPQASGAPQGKDDKGKGGFSSTGETQTFTVSDDTTVKIVTMKDGSADSSDGSVSDLTKGTMIRIQYTDSSKKTIKEVDVSKMDDNKQSDRK